MKKETIQLKKQLGKLLLKSLLVSRPVAGLEQIREKVEERGYQGFDKGDIMEELGRLQGYVRDLNAEMLRLYDLLEQESYGNPRD